VCGRCWDELFGHLSDLEEYVQCQALVGEQGLEAARLMIERVNW
jgi:hypothetical protein